MVQAPSRSSNGGPSFLDDRSAPIEEISDGRCRWWTFGGGAGRGCQQQDGDGSTERGRLAHKYLRHAEEFERLAKLTRSGSDRDMLAIRGAEPTQACGSHTGRRCRPAIALAA